MCVCVRSSSGTRARGVLYTRMYLLKYSPAHFVPSRRRVALRKIRRVREFIARPGNIVVIASRVRWLQSPEGRPDRRRAVIGDGGP